MTTAAKLRSHTVKDLAAMAKAQAVPGWHNMRKDELIRALVNKARAEAARKARKKRSTGGESSRKRGGTASDERKATAARARSNGAATGKADASKEAKRGKTGNSQSTSAKRKEDPKPRSAAVARRIDEMHRKKSKSKDLAYSPADEGSDRERYSKDRLIVLVRGPHWLHAYWELRRQSIERVRVAMGQHWHTARPVLRLFRVVGDGTSSVERQVEHDIDIHGGVNDWYIHVDDVPRTYQIDIGYVMDDGELYSLARSNVVTTPQSGAVDPATSSWAPIARDYERIYALSGGYESSSESSDLKEVFEERLRRPMGASAAARFGHGAQGPHFRRKDLNLKIDAEMIVYGTTDPNVQVTIKGEPVRMQPDGTFAARFSLRERRQVLPIVANTNDGIEQRTIVLAVERNTKVLEPIIRDSEV